MQEIFEGQIGEFKNMYEDALRHTDVVDLLRDIKLQRALAENSHLRAEREIRDYKEGDPSDEHTLDCLVREASDFARIVETFDYVIDVIESGKYAKEK